MAYKNNPYNTPAMFSTFRMSFQRQTVTVYLQVSLVSSLPKNKSCGLIIQYPLLQFKQVNQDWDR